VSHRPLPAVLALAALAGVAVLAAPRAAWADEGAEERACDFDRSPLDLGAFGDLHLFAVQNLTASDLWVEGDVAAGFGLSMARFDVGAGGGGPAVQSSYGLSLVDGSVHGDVVSAAFNNLLRVSLVDGGELLPATSAAPGLPLTALLDLSARLTDLPATGETTLLPWGALRLRGADPRLNVFDVTVADLAVVSGLRIEAPAGAAVVINVEGFATAIGDLNVQLSGPTAEDLLWNFETAPTITVVNSTLYGTIVAPQAILSMRGGWFEGAAVARSIVTSTSTAWAPFTNAVDSCPAAAPVEPGACRARHVVTGSWPIVRGDAGIAEVEVEWTGPAQPRWELGWRFTRGETITDSWGGIFSTAGVDVTVRQPAWGAGIEPGGRVQVGYIAIGRAGLAAPATTTLNGVACSAW